MTFVSFFFNILSQQPSSFGYFEAFLRPPTMSSFRAIVDRYLLTDAASSVPPASVILWITSFVVVINLSSFLDPWLSQVAVLTSALVPSLPLFISFLPSVLTITHYYSSHF